MALGPWARADDLRRLESQIGQVNDRLDFIYSMRPFMEQIKEYFSKCGVRGLRTDATFEKRARGTPGIR